ncbi:steroid dehydrogenase [Anopheles darlingi]|uniref:Steroid dehydrogenase n=1 Tax=Anopheles darlingi TaxID=43151 RepID=W5JBN5_ANODA|nr:inactive hydroxysteroid dehydrogenase-like protein 1 [Anopheles darlingi]ETN60179.1 steroid dehydrogenase [Anopheles darlingi]
MITTLLTVIGALSVLSWLYENLRNPVVLLIHRFKVTRENSLAQKYGEWAVITGGSDGIGKAYAHYLAQKGMKVLLVARNAVKLTKVSQEINEKYGVDCRYAVADFSKGEQIFPQLEKELAPYDIGILVNNVGVINEKPILLERMDKALLWNLININVGAATLLCNIVIPKMKSNKRGLIVNISSMSALAPTPYLNVYAATKAYMTSFSHALHEELKPYGIECQTVSPGFVHTSMTEYLAPTEGSQAPLSRRLLKVNDFIRYAGYTLGKVSTTCGHWSHGIQVGFLKMLPETLRLRIFTRMYTQLLSEFSEP